MKTKDCFYESRAWRELRYRVLREQGASCGSCNATRESGAVLHVDHIKPRSLYRDLELEQSNLQVLCADCNYGKSNKFTDDFRRRAKPNLATTLSPSERVVLAVIVNSPDFFRSYADVLGRLPPGATPADLFDHAYARAWFYSIERNSLLVPSDFVGPLTPAPKSLEGVLFDAFNSKNFPYWTKQHISDAMDRQVCNAWARRSYQIKTWLKDAERSGDERRHAELMKSYLDCRRAMEDMQQIYGEL